ncbi:MAG: GntR family transcriptional regulator [Lentisphaeria bacterium]|nr:GntR family transcriptional regulator [Lentisphaeria bacterium]
MQTYRDIAREIERRILCGIYPAETLLPSRLELMREFNVARATLDRAIKELVNSRRLSSRRGSGTTVNPLSEHRRDIAVIGWNSGVVPDFHKNLRCRIFKSELLAKRSNWNMLYEYDALLWRFPSRSEMAVIDAVNGRIPQVVVNRVIPGVNCISTDHRGAYRVIVSERMEEIPEALPVFMSSGGDSLPGQYRFEGFSDACRSAGRFYELWNFTPEQDFKSVSDGMIRRLASVSGRKLLVVSDSCQLTGAFVRAVDKAGLKFAEDIWYSDFDNEYPENVWGVRITSFIQDYGALMRAAVDRIDGLLNGSADAGAEHKLIFPLRRNGDT